MRKILIISLLMLITILISAKDFIATIQAEHDNLYADIKVLINPDTQEFIEIETVFISSSEVNEIVFPIGNAHPHELVVQEVGAYRQLENCTEEFSTTNIYETENNHQNAEVLNVSKYGFMMCLEAAGGDISWLEYDVDDTDYNEICSGIEYNFPEAEPQYRFLSINSDIVPYYLDIIYYDEYGTGSVSTNEIHYGNEVPYFNENYYWYNGSWNGGDFIPLQMECTPNPQTEVIFDIYSNIEGANATIYYFAENPWNSGEIDDQCILKKGWNQKVYEVDYFDYNDCIVEITCEGISSESFSVTQVDFSWDYDSEYWQSEDLEFTFDNKPLNSDWNWESFPMLPVNNGDANNEEQDIVTLFQDNLLPANYLTAEMQKYAEQSLNFDGQYWVPSSFNIQSSDGTKLNITGNSDYYYVADGTRIDADTSIDLQAGINWIGYWLPHSLVASLAFGEDWDKVKYIKAEDWYYYDRTPERDGMGQSASEIPRPLHYGEGYEIYLRESITDFQWSTGNERPNDYRKPDPEVFSPEKKADYEVIDVVNIDPEISEIGVFEGNNCIGAVVVEKDCEQILVYSDSANRGNAVLTFQVALGRGVRDVSDYKILYNTGIQEYENVLVAGHQEYSIIELGEPEANDVPNVESTLVLYPNYPNPFNPETRISFDLPKSELILLSVFNTKGQKVKTLAKGKFEKGLQTLIWNGTDDNEKPVTSGIYLYRLESETKTISRKMLLLK